MVTDTVMGRMHVHCLLIVYVMYCLILCRSWVS